MQLNLPEQRAMPGVDTRPGPLRSWLASLPYVDAVATTTQIVERLQDINDQRIPAKLRLELLALFRNSYVRLHESLRIIACAQDNPQQSAAILMLTEFSEHMAFGYKYALRDALSERQRWGKSKQFATAANYAQEFLAQTLICRYQCYLPATDLPWRELGDLVRFAETQQLGSTHDTDFPFSSGELHIFTTYRRLTMLRLADPYRMTAGMIWEAYGYIAAKSMQIELLKQFEGSMPIGVYGVSLDHEPRESRRAPASGVERNAWRWLDARAFLHGIEQDLDRLSHAGPTQRAGFINLSNGPEASQLLSRMYGQWTRSYLRKSPRFNASAEVEISPGLEAAYFFLNNCVAFDARDYATPEDEDSIDFSVTGLRASHTTPRQFRLIACPIRNRGGGGIALHLGKQQGLAVWVGQLLLINADQIDSDSGNEWLVGIVRWLIHHNHIGSEIGVQYVARECRAVVIRPSAGSLRSFQPALKNELPLSNGQRLDILIAPKGLYRNKSLLELQERGQSYQIRCEQLLETGSGYERFCYELIS